MTTRQMAESIASFLREGYQNIQQRGSSVNEAVTRSVLIDEVLKELGYPPVNRTPEDGDRDNRPDYSCFLNPVSERPGPAALIVEAKTYQTDFDRGWRAAHGFSRPSD